MILCLTLLLTYSWLQIVHCIKFLCLPKCQEMQSAYKYEHALFRHIAPDTNTTMAVNAVFTLFAFCVLGSLLCETSAATCKKVRTCPKQLARQRKVYYSCGWWGMGRCSRYVTEYYTIYQTCIKPCTHGRWSEWSQKDLTHCSATCDKGYKYIQRSRTCNNPAPQNGGNYCEGEPAETSRVSCFEKHCPIDGGWSDYSGFTPWSDCSGNCDQSRNRNRTCTEPKPQYGGLECDGDSMDKQIRDCFKGECLDESCKSRRKAKQPLAALPRNCKQYVSCSHTNKLMDCGNGTYYDPEALTCNHKHRVGCETDTEDEPEPCAVGDFIVDEEDLGTYYVCGHDNQLSVPMKCPAGLVFKTASKSCDWA